MFGSYLKSGGKKFNDIDVYIESTKRPALVTILINELIQENPLLDIKIGSKLNDPYKLEI